VPDFNESVCQHSGRKTLKVIMVHLYDARPHNLRKLTEYIEQFRAHRVPHLAYTSDIAPNDFFLFVSVKSKLPDLTTQSMEDIICEIWRLFEEIPKVTFIFVYALCVQRFKWVIQNGGDYFHWLAKTASSDLEMSEKKPLNGLFDLF
jgi:hypothetical protein